MKKRKNVRIARAAAALLLLLTVLSSCGSHGAGRADESDFSLADLAVVEPEKKKSGIESFGDIVLDNFIVLRENDSDNTVFVLEENADLLEVEIYKRNTYLSSEYGLSMTENITGDIVTRVKAEIYSNSPSYDMLQFKGTSAATLITSGTLTDMAALSSFDQSLAGYHTSVIDSLSARGHTFLLAGDATPSLMLNTSCVLLNTELEKKLAGNNNVKDLTGGASLIEVAANGKFTVDLMLACSRAMATLNGASDEEIEASASVSSASIKVSPEKALALYLGNGLKFYQIDKITDEITPTAFGTEFGNAYLTLEKIYGIDETTEKFPEKGSANPLFSVSDIRNLVALLKENSPFVPLPIPKYSAAAKSYSCCVSLNQTTFNALPQTAPDLEGRMEIINLIYALSSDIKSAPRNILYNSVSGSDSSEGTVKKAEYAAKSFDVILESARADLISLFNYGDLPGFMEECIRARTTRNAFMTQGAIRAAAAVRGVAISLEKIS